MNYTIFMEPDIFAAFAYAIAGKTGPFSIRFNGKELLSAEMKFHAASMHENGKMLVEFSPAPIPTAHVNEVAAAAEAK